MPISIIGYFLSSVFWDNEDVGEHSQPLSQQLFAQNDKGDILLYTVDREGVTVPVKISASKIQSIIKTDPQGKCIE